MPVSRSHLERRGEQIDTQGTLLPFYRPHLHRASDVSQFGPLGNRAGLADKICPWSQLSSLGQKAQPNRWNLTDYVHIRAATWIQSRCRERMWSQGASHCEAIPAPAYFCIEFVMTQSHMFCWFICLFIALYPARVRSSWE